MTPFAFIICLILFIPGVVGMSTLKFNLRDRKITFAGALWRAALYALYMFLVWVLAVT